MLVAVRVYFFKNCVNYSIFPIHISSPFQIRNPSKINFENVLGQLPSLTITEGECAIEEKVCPQSCDTVEAKGEPVSVCDRNFVSYRTRFHTLKISRR